ncbi:MAG: M20/M25/M40 family metallo-hydrolase [Treponema sp.]|jgi:succinyl-diaminopimelate desuccinylase|nr:M20/M25/M40 family metallo-hydrolase [Treponema sp.]
MTKYDDHDETAGLLSSLIGINTSNPPGNEAALAAFIQRYLTGEGAGAGAFRVVDHGGGRASLVLDLPGGNPGLTLGFAGHMDTVPPGERAEWRSDPFRAERREGFVHGRGAADMKGGLTAMILLARSYLRDGPPPVNLRFFFTADEEAAGMGAAALRDAGFFGDLAFLFICEPTGGHPGVCEKGIVWYDFTLQGRTSHASMPERGINALEAGFEYLAGVKEKIAALAAAPHPLLGTNTCSVTLAQGGVKINVIPDRAAFSADIRCVPGTELPRVEAALDEAAGDLERRHPGLVITRTCRDRRPALEADVSHPAAAFMVDLCGKEAGKKPLGLFYFTDASLVIPFYPRLPFMILGPGLPGECHCPNEKIAPGAIIEAAARYRQFVEAARGEWFS